jgi:nickel/cobalt exporter
MTNTLSLVYFPAAVLLGALHAMEPGHAKALTASYLIGIKGTKKDSILLGLSVAATHSVVVIAISMIGLWLGNEAFTGHATEWLERGSGFVAIAIGSYMLYRRLFIKRDPANIHAHHHAPNPVAVKSSTLDGIIEIIDTPLGERIRFTTYARNSTAQLLVEIKRDNSVERLHLTRSPEDSAVYLSEEVPGEPHEFKAQLILEGQDSFDFEMFEPEGHDDKSHAHMDDEAHARAHAATLPSYVNTGEKPTSLQIMAFGAAGGMIPCPASITVMLLALSTGKAAMGVFTVLGFSLGLALSLVGIGLIVVTGLSKLSNTNRFAWVSKHAPAFSAVLVIASGFAALFIAR